MLYKVEWLLASNKRPGIYCMGDSAHAQLRFFFPFNKYFISCEAVAYALYCVVEKACTLV